VWSQAARWAVTAGVTGSVVNTGVIAAGSATPGFIDSPTGTFTIVGNLLNQGLIQLASGESVDNMLEVRGSYVGAGGTMAINTFLGGDGSPSDRLIINGDPAATGETFVRVTNVGGEVRAGAFDYDLFRRGV
jgi:type V secretory pathway adhesin AidA